MRYINKQINKATAYRDWLTNLGDQNHPKYTSSSFWHYYSIVYDLLICQKGLCAYTEKFLTSIEEIEEDLWLTENCAQFKFAGQLDHFDPNLKVDKGWSWDNFFVSDTDVNTKNKKKISPYGILKPDQIGFNSDNLLQYNISEHIFIPKISLAENQREEIKHDLFVLGVNFEPIVQLRKKYLKPIFAKIKFEQDTIDSLRNGLYQFFTAFEMSINDI